MTRIQTPLLTGDPRRKGTGGVGPGAGAETGGAGLGAEIGGASQGAKTGDDDQGPRSGDTRTETDTGGGQDLETGGPDPDLCPPQDPETKGPGRPR